MSMRRGNCGELYFEPLARHHIEVMIPARNAETKRDVIEYIEEHFNEERQLVLKAELEEESKNETWISR